jgi:DNA-binding MarR family transcriptional regulator
VLVKIAREPDARIRDIAESIGITERAAQRIIAELVEADYLEKERSGRRNSYRIRTNRPLRHPLERDHQVGELLDAVSG